MSSLIKLGINGTEKLMNIRMNAIADSIAVMTSALVVTRGLVVTIQIFLSGDTPHSKIISLQTLPGKMESPAGNQRGKILGHTGQGHCASSRTSFVSLIRT